MDDSSSNVVQILLLLEIHHQNRQAVLAATGMNGLTHFIIVNGTEIKLPSINTMYVLSLVNRP